MKSPRLSEGLAGPGWCVSLLILACLAAMLLPACQEKPAATPSPPVVEVVDVIQKDVPIYYEWVGTADGFINATIRAQVSGYLIKQNYQEGDFVKKGQVLFEIDPRTFQAGLEQAEGQLAQQQARWENAKVNLTRMKSLEQQGAVSRKDLDDATSDEHSARAAVAAAKAAAEKARLDLGFTRITSPIDGIAGIAKAQIGNLLGPGQAEELTTVSTVNPIKIYISISEREYLMAAEKHMRPGEMPLELLLADGSVYPHQGKFFYADRQVDMSTGTIRVAALFKNPGNLLRPGQFARVRALIETKEGALLVPQRTVSELQGSYQVAVVGADNRVEVRPVKPAERVGTLWVIESGVKPGERVVAEGVQKVKNGMPVTPKAFAPQPPAGPGASPQPEGRPAAGRR